MKTNYSKKQLGRVKVNKSVFNDEVVHNSMKRLLNLTDSKSIKLPIIHTKVLIPGDFRNLISQYKISARMVTNLDIENKPNHIFCDQLGSHLCWRCSQKFSDQRMKLEIEKVLKNSNPNILPRLICVENVLENMNLPFYSLSEINQWKTNKSESKDSPFPNEPLFFPYSNAIADLDEFNTENRMSNFSSSSIEYKYNKTQTVNNQSKVIARSSQVLLAEKELMQYISPPVIQEF